MLGIRYFKADPSTYVMKSVNGQTIDKGKGLSFLYNAIKTSITAVPVNAQEAPFIFGLQTADFQEIRVQGQITFRIDDPEMIAGMLNFTVGKDGMLCIFEIKDRDPQKTGATLQQNLFSSEILTEKSEMDQFNNDAQQLE